MITLITGTPGAGKTLYAVANELPRFPDRPLIVDGIPDLAIPHTPADDVLKWHEWAPEGAVIVVDEAQRIWRPRSAGSQVPPSVAAMETHRHKGVDFILITQHPNLIDPNIRRLVGRHIHVRRMFGWKRAVIYEWDSATDPGRVSTAIKRSWPYPKKAFSLYKSATMHTARPQRVPVVVWVLGLSVFAVPAIWWYAAHRTISHIDEPVAAGAAGSAAHGPREAAHAVGASVVPKSIVEALTPTDAQNPLSAPLFASVAPPVVAPEVVGCIASSKRCTCYSQQQTPVWLPDDQCRQRAAGLYYDPYRNPPPISQTIQAATSPKEPEVASSKELASPRIDADPIPRHPST